MSARKRLLGYILQYKRSYIAGLVMVLVSNCAFVAPALILYWTVKYVRLSRAPEFVSKTLFKRMGEDGAIPPIDWSVIWLAIASILLFFAIRGLSLYMMRMLIVVNSRRVEADLRRDIFSKLLSLSFSYFNKMRIGDIMSRATFDTEQVRMLAGPAIMFTLSSTVNLIIVLAVYFSISWQLALFMLIPYVGMISIVSGIFRKLRKASLSVREHYATISDRARESFAGMKVLKSFAQEEEEIKRFDKLSTGYIKKNLRLVMYEGGLRGFIIFFSGLGMALILFIGAYLIATGRMEIEAMGAFIYIQLKMTWPLMVFGWVAILYQRGIVAMERVNEVLSTEPDIADDPGALPFEITKGEIEIRDVSYAYTEERGTILKGVSLAIPAGSTTAIVGNTASGKSTLIGLIPRLFDPAEGRVLVDGRDVKTIPLKQLRAAVGYSPQEPFLFSDTIYNNISFAAPDATEAEVEEVARRAAIHDEIEEFTDGYDTLVGERGLTVSGGQKQRIAIARAILRRPPILILDDSLSSVDTKTEEDVMKGLAEVIAGGTSIIVTHRLTAVTRVDLIVVMDEGRIAETGTHSELMDADGLYAKMYRRQLIARDLED